MAIVTGTGGSEFRPRRAEAVKVLGVDILRDRTMRDYAVCAAVPSTTAGSANRRRRPVVPGSSWSC